MDLPVEQKKKIIIDRIKLLDIFYSNNSDIDLRLTDFFEGENKDKKNGERKWMLNWNGIPDTERQLVKKQLMAYQRILNLGEGTADRELLLSKGYDSAIKVARKNELEFVRSSGLSEGKSSMVYAKAKNGALMAAHYYQAIHDAINGGFNDVFMSNISPGLINDLMKINGFDDLFGPQNFCGCKHCKSILSPAAYFVDLMAFIEKYISKPTFETPNKTDHPLYLRRRRGDL